MPSASRYPFVASARVTGSNVVLVEVEIDRLDVGVFRKCRRRRPLHSDDLLAILNDDRLLRRRGGGLGGLSPSSSRVAREMTAPIETVVRRNDVTARCVFDKNATDA